MRYVILACENAADFSKRQDHANMETYMAPWVVYTKAMQEAGIMKSGEALEAPDTATTVRLRNGTRQVQDGPFADAKEQMGGFFIIDVPDLDAALDWAAKCPAAETGAVEVRPIWEIGG
ncbi:MAG: YciI family protein [Geminicoccaceae bacterium]